ncbi:MAG TPA: site-specific integrase [Fimbriimonadaceae bacterium]
MDKHGKTHTTWTGYVYASNYEHIWGTGSTQKSAEERARQNCTIYEVLLSSGNEHAQALKQIQRLRKGPLSKLGYEGMLAHVRARTIAPTLPTPIVPASTSDKGGMTLRSFVFEKHLPYAGMGKYESERRSRRFGRMLCDWVPSNSISPLGDWLVTNLQPCHFQEMLNRMKNRDRKDDPNEGDNYLADFSGFVKKVLLMMYTYDLMHRDFRPTLPSVPRPTKKKLNKGDIEIENVFRKASDSRMRAFTTLAYLSGCLSEILGLTEECIEGNEVKIMQQLTRVPNPSFDESKLLSRDNPKTILALVPWLKRTARKRSFYLTDELMREVMNSLDRAKPSSIYDVAEKKFVVKLFVISNKDGGPWHPHDFRPQWNKLCESAGVKVNPHEFRAICVRDERKDGTSLDVLAELLGHSSSRTTELSYLRHRDDGSETKQLSLSRSKRLEEVVRSARTERLSVATSE